ncbi:MAG: head-tail adaptor protein [Chloroflexota bacterium]
MFNRSVQGYMRGLARRRVLTSTALIEREEQIRDESYLNNSSWVEVGTVRCRLLPASTNTTDESELFAGQESIEQLKTLAVPHDAEIGEGYRVTVNGETYYVAALNLNNTDEVFKQVLVVQRSGADG